MELRLVPHPRDWSARDFRWLEPLLGKRRPGLCGFLRNFEGVKNHAFYTFLVRFYARGFITSKQDRTNAGAPRAIRPHYAIEPVFLLLAGVSASVVQSLIQYPLNLVQEIHYQRISAVDRLARQRVPVANMARGYWIACRRTFKICRRMALKAGRLHQWLYQGFAWKTARQIPSTSAGLIIFELVRRRYANDREATTLRANDYEIILT